MLFEDVDITVVVDVKIVVFVVVVSASLLVEMFLS